MYNILYGSFFFKSYSKVCVQLYLLYLTFFMLRESYDHLLVKFSKCHQYFFFIIVKNFNRLNRIFVSLNSVL